MIDFIDSSNTRCDLLKLEIKNWERSHLERNGSKPTRKDIKADACIAAKYTEYENLRAIIVGKAPPHNAKSRSKSKSSLKASQTKQAKDVKDTNSSSSRVSKISHPQTPSKRVSKTNIQDAIFMAPPPPSPFSNISPEAPKPLMIGPTPQKNGIFVSIFSSILDTPSTASNRHPLIEISNTQVLPQTPSRRHSTRSTLTTATEAIIEETQNANEQQQTPQSATSRFIHTPMSSSKRRLFDQFKTHTPNSEKSKRKRDEADQTTNNEGPDTPSSIGKKFCTPKLWKRYSTLESLDEDGDDEKPEPRRGVIGGRLFLKSLSSMIKEKKQEEEKEKESQRFAELDQMLNDEEELLRELEGDLNDEIDLDRDGFVDANVGEEIRKINDEETKQAEAQGTVRKVWKKKGLKRQTRRVIMRPIKNAPKNIDYEKLTEKIESNSDDNYEDEEEYDERLSTEANEKANSKPNSSSSSRRTADRNNYRKLKIKSKNTKGKGRFRRR